jgi:hypothetical protein
MSLKAVSIGSAGSAVGMHLITGGTNATPIVATFAANSGLKSGDRVAISGITGLTAMNGEWELEAVSATTFKLLGSVGNGTYGGTPRCALIFDRTPLMEDHSLVLETQGNCVGTLLIEQFGSYEEFAAGDNSKLGAVQAPVRTSAQSFITNTNATSASSSTIASSSIVMAATAEGVGYEVKMAKYARFSLSAWTSGTIAGLVMG